MEVLPTGALGQWHSTVFVTPACMGCTGDLRKTLWKRYLTERHHLRHIDVSVMSLVYPWVVRLATANVASSLVGGIGTSSEWFFYRLTMRPACAVLLVCQVRKSKKNGAQDSWPKRPLLLKGCPIDCETIRNNKTITSTKYDKLITYTS